MMACPHQGSLHNNSILTISYILLRVTQEKEHLQEEKRTRSVDQSETIKPAKKAKVEKKPKPEKDEGGGGEDGGDDDGDVGLL